MSELNFPNPEIQAPTPDIFDKIYGVDFNPGGNLMVHTIKKTFAELSRMVDAYCVEKNSGIPQFMYDQMINDALKAQMMMVKVATWSASYRREFQKLHTFLSLKVILMVGRASYAFVWASQ